jgi:SAM-dependent methyltransferase
MSTDPSTGAPSNSTLGLGQVRWGDLRRLSPISRKWGYDRGLPVDRYYIERFLEARRDDIRDRVLEIGDDSYTRGYGGDRVHTSDVLHVRPGHPGATIVADLSCAPEIPDESFDCIILTQTLQLIFDVNAALATVARILKPSGVLLATVPGISRIDYGEWRSSWYWGFTTISARALFERRFDPERLRIDAHGNVLATTAFLYGLATEELSRSELDERDPAFELVITVRAERAPRSESDQRATP